MRSLPIKRLFAHYAPYQEFAKNPDYDMDEIINIGPFSLIDVITTDEYADYALIDFNLHPHVATYEKKFKQKFKAGIDWQSIENNLIKRMEKTFQEAVGSETNIRVTIEGESDEGELVCVVVVTSPFGIDISALQLSINSQLAGGPSINFQCRDPNNKKYITMQADGFCLSTLRGGNWGLADWQFLARRMPWQAGMLPQSTRW